MLLWLGLVFLAAGLASFAIDRRAVHFFHDDVDNRWAAMVHRTTDWAKGAHWLTISISCIAGAWLLKRAWPANVLLSRIETVALAFLISLACSSAVLHTVKIVLGRRRPRDELELGLYGWRPFRFDLQYDSFPSGHALTIFCVATVMSGAVPELAMLWFAVAVYLAMTRAILNSHYVSDVFFGAAVGLLVTRAVLLEWFAQLAQGWF